MHAASVAFIFTCAVSAVVLADTPKHHPAWSLSADAKRKLSRNASKLRVGDSYDTVIATLGKPTYDRTMMAKETNRALGRSLMYYVVRWDAGLVNERHDELVDIWLDTHNRVKEVSIRITSAQ